MRGKTKRPSRRLMTAAIDLAAAGRLINAVGTPPCDGDPVQARGFRDTAGRWRRVQATYANGWKATLNLHLDGTGSLSWGLRLVGEIKGAAA